MSVWLRRRRVSVAEKSGRSWAKLTIARRVHVTWSSHSLRIASWNFACLAIALDETATAWSCPSSAGLPWGCWSCPSLRVNERAAPARGGVEPDREDETDGFHCLRCQPDGVGVLRPVRQPGEAGGDVQGVRAEECGEGDRR